MNKVCKVCKWFSKMVVVFGIATAFYQPGALDADMFAVGIDPADILPQDESYAVRCTLPDATPVSFAPFDLGF